MDDDRTDNEEADPYHGVWWVGANGWDDVDAAIQDAQTVSATTTDRVDE